MKKDIKKKISSAVIFLAKKAAVMEANSACVFLTYQPKESKAIKKLRRF